MKGLPALILSLVVGILLIAFGAPRMIAAFAMIPSGPVLEKIQDRDLIEMEDLGILVASQRRGLMWSVSGRKWTDLGLAQMLMAEQREASDPERRRLINDAIQSLRNGLAVAPASPFAWTRLAFAEVFKSGASPAALSAFRFGMVVAPYEPRLALARISLGFSVWPKLQPPERRKILQQVRFAWNHRDERKQLLEFARQESWANLVRAALLRAPDDLAEFEARLRKLSE
mgnify:FL=1